MPEKLKPLYWVGSSKEDLKKSPADVRQVMGYALYLAQTGRRHPDAKPLKGFGGAGVLEIVEQHKGDAYRGVYTVKLRGAVYVLHAFKKKSKRGVKTPRREIQTVRRRLRMAERFHERTER